MLGSEKTDLKHELNSLLEILEAQVDEIARTAQNMGISPVALRYSDGTHALAPLLVAQAQALNALVHLHKE